MSYQELELKVIQWGEARGIVQNAKPMGQAIKTLEEVTELIDAINRGHHADTVDAIGDVAVTLIMVCATLDLDLTQCLSAAYDQIKNRKGYLTPEGIFVKEVAQ